MLMLTYIKQQKKKTKFRVAGYSFFVVKVLTLHHLLYIGSGKGRIKRSNKEEKIIYNAENNQSKCLRRASRAQPTSAQENRFHIRIQKVYAQQRPSSPQDGELPFRNACVCRRAVGAVSGLRLSAGHISLPPQFHGMPVANRRYRSASWRVLRYGKCGNSDATARKSGRTKVRPTID